jgi:hypothetical protein
VCDTTTDPVTLKPREACCFNPNGQQACRRFLDCDCNSVRCTGLQICCFNLNFGFETCIDPTRDNNNCGGCSLTRDDLNVDERFTCEPGQVCLRNFDFSLSLDPVEQNNNGTFIGECKLNCASNRVQCPGGLNEGAGEPYTQAEQSCVDPLSSDAFCGALLKADATSTTTGQCSEANPQTFGQLRNFRGVRCGGGEVCRSKLLCNNPEPFPGTDNAGNLCDPRTHYYYDVSMNEADPAFASATPLPEGSVFVVDDFSSQAERDAYIENLYLRAVCDPNP